MIRNLEIIGEAVKQVSEQVREKRSDIPWRAVAGLRDILVYGCGPDRCLGRRRRGSPCAEAGSCRDPGHTQAGFLIEYWSCNVRLVSSNYFGLISMAGASALRFVQVLFEQVHPGSTTESQPS